MKVILSKSKGSERFDGFDYVISFPETSNANEDPKSANCSFFQPIQAISDDLCYISMKGKKMHDGVSRVLRYGKTIKDNIINHIIEQGGFAFVLTNYNSEWSNIILPDLSNVLGGIQQNTYQYMPGYSYILDNTGRNFWLCLMHSLHGKFNTEGRYRLVSKLLAESELSNRINNTYSALTSGGEPLWPKMKKDYYDPYGLVKTSMTAQVYAQASMHFGMGLIRSFNRGILDINNEANDTATSAYCKDLYGTARQAQAMSNALSGRYRASVAPVLMPVVCVKFNAIDVIVSATVTLKHGVKIQPRLPFTPDILSDLDKMVSEYGYRSYSSRSNSFAGEELKCSITDLADAFKIVDSSGVPLKPNEIREAVDVSVGVGIGVNYRPRNDSWKIVQINDKTVERSNQLFANRFKFASAHLPPNPDPINRTMTEEEIVDALSSVSLIDMLPDEAASSPNSAEDLCNMG